MTEKLTQLLIKDFNPKFLAYDLFENNINIVIASDCFINQAMVDRIRSVYACVENNLPELFEKNSIFVHAFTEDQLLDVLKSQLEEGI